MFLLIATLFFANEARFLQQLWLIFVDVQFFRNLITRKNIRYRMYRITAVTTLKQKYELVKMIQTVRTELLNHQKMVMYNSWVKNCKNLTNSLECETYFHDVENKNGIFQRFVFAEQFNIVVAINVFELKIDVTYIRCVIYMNKFRSLLNYSQKNGQVEKDD